VAAEVEHRQVFFVRAQPVHLGAGGDADFVERRNRRHNRWGALWARRCIRHGIGLG
jgi:hypothetical protein